MPKIIAKSAATRPRGALSMQSEGRFVCVGYTGEATPDLGKCDVTASVTSAPNDGTTTFTVEVQLRDAQGNIVPLNAGTVTVSPSPSGAGHVSIGAVSYIALGLYRATATTGTTQETCVISARVDGDLITETASVGIGVFEDPDIFGPDDLTNITLDDTSGEFRRSGVCMGLKGWAAHMSYYEILDHPLGGSKAVRLDYGYHSNHNIGVYNPGTMAFGDDLWAAGKFYFEGRDWDQSAGQDGSGGKLEQYLAPYDGGIQFVMCYSAIVNAPVTSTKLGWYIICNDGSKDSEDWCTANEDFAHWGRKECYIDQQVEYDYIRHFKMNSGYGVADGVCEFWIDGVRVFWKDNVPWYNANNGKTTRFTMAFGDQFNVPPGDRHAYRWWRDFLVSTTRPR